MDSKLPQLDPKLKEAYDRVLNGQNTQPAQPVQNPLPPSPQPLPVFQPQQPQPPIQQIDPIGPQTISSAPQANFTEQVMPTVPPQPKPFVATPELTTPIQPIQPTPAPQPIMPSMQPPQPQSIQTPPAQNIGGSIAYNAAGSTAAQTVVKKGKPNILHMLLGIGAVVFLVAYTFMWIFIFKIKLPFLPA